MSGGINDLSLPPLPLSLLSNATESDGKLHTWNIEAKKVAITLQNELSLKNLESLRSETESMAACLAIAVPLSSNESWVEASLHQIGKNILCQLPLPTLEVLQCILSQHIKPWFQKSLHSRIDATTGRKLARPAGGPAGAMDFYDDQNWKSCSWLAPLLMWCTINLEADQYNHVWPLLIPPIMTFLDDYDSHCKFQGVKIVSEMLNHVPSELLKKTGIDGLIKTSLKNAILHLHSSLTPDILSVCIPAFLKSIRMTTVEGTKDRFNQVSSLLADGIIGGVWTYAYNDYDALEASIRTLPVVIQELGIGTARYLKAIISQLCYNISSVSSSKETIPLQIASLEILMLLIKACQSPITKWSGTIVSSLARSWTSLQGISLPESEEVRSALQSTVSVLANVYPPVIQNEYAELLRCDDKVFRSLIYPPSSDIRL